MKLAVYGFISILALVCLATIVNSTFAALLAQRRSLATLQSVGTTPGQATLIVQVQHALLFLRGWVYGSTLGVLGTYLLFRQMRVGYRGVQVHLPWSGVAVIGLVLILVWCGFALVSHRMLTHQNIEQKLRAE